jgi:hypothetical protein
LISAILVSPKFDGQVVGSHIVISRGFGYYNHSHYAHSENDNARWDVDHANANHDEEEPQVKHYCVNHIDLWFVVFAHWLLLFFA